MYFSVPFAIAMASPPPHDEPAAGPTSLAVTFAHFVAAGERRCRVFEEFCRTLVPAVDCEDPWGPSCFLAWVYHNNFLLAAAAAEEPNPLFGTVLMFDRDDDDAQFLGCGSLVVDDRGVRSKFGLVGDGIWGGVVVPRHLRSRGLGGRIIRELHRRCQQVADRKGGDAVFYLYANVEHAIRVYEAVGYTRVRTITLDDGEVATLFMQVYKPSSA